MNKIPVEILKELEDKITERIMENIESLIEKKCKAVMEGNMSLEEVNKPAGKLIEKLSEEMQAIQKEMKMLADSTDEALGSLTYLANEYDDMNVKISKLTINYPNLTKEVVQIKSSQRQLEIQLDNLEQYGRRENLDSGDSRCSSYEERKHQSNCKIYCSISSYQIR